jgi:predicted trehalose synthase
VLPQFDSSSPAAIGSSYFLPLAAVWSPGGGELTAFFMLERAVHELSYELAYRPGWAEIPLQGILAIMATGRGREGGASERLE